MTIDLLNPSRSPELYSDGVREAPDVNQSGVCSQESQGDSREECLFRSTAQDRTLKEFVRGARVRKSLLGNLIVFTRTTPVRVTMSTPSPRQMDGSWRAFRQRGKHERSRRRERLNYAR